uniref:Putative K+ channel toxin n=1 Tax=Superstitionia donensis TaxID=311983 RepID=A0A1V1WBV9_9SCOR
MKAVLIIILVLAVLEVAIGVPQAYAPGVRCRNNRICQEVCPRSTKCINGKCRCYKG